MQLAEIVATSLRVAEVSGRLAKVGHLAACLERCRPDEAAIAVGLLAGAPRQGRIGIGYATLRTARAAPPAASPSVTLVELDASLDRL